MDSIESLYSFCGMRICNSLVNTLQAPAWARSAFMHSVVARHRGFVARNEKYGPANDVQRATCSGRADITRSSEDGRRMAALAESLTLIATSINPSYPQDQMPRLPGHANRRRF